MEVVSVILSNVQWEMLGIQFVWYRVEEESMCTGYKYGTAFCVLNYFADM
jgi:hypothetical protein